MSVAIIAIVVIAVMILIGVLSYRANKKRQEAFRAWAATRGWTYTTRDDSYEGMPWGPPFGMGSGRAAFDVLQGNWGDRPGLCFTYRYQTQSSDGKTTRTENHWFAIYSLHLPRSLPELRVSREGVFSKLARKMGIHDIEFESEDFNREFKVKAEDRKFAYDVVNPQMMQLLMENNAEGFVIVGPDIVRARSGRLTPEAVEPGLAYLAQIVEHIPSFVWDASA